LAAPWAMGRRHLGPGNGARVEGNGVVAVTSQGRPSGSESRAPVYPGLRSKTRCTLGYWWAPFGLRTGASGDHGLERTATGGLRAERHRRAAPQGCARGLAAPWATDGRPAGSGARTLVATSEGEASGES